MEKTKEMTQEREAAILEAAINKWGNRLQIVVAIEELSELQKALCKYLRCLAADADCEDLSCAEAAIKEEIADASIMLNQLELIFGDCTEEEVRKLERLEKLVGNVRQQTLAEKQPDGTCKLKDPPSLWTPEDVRTVAAIKQLYPKAQYVVRASNGGLVACEFLAPSGNGWYAEFSKGLCSALAFGLPVPVDDILAEGGDE